MYQLTHIRWTNGQSYDPDKVSYTNSENLNELLRDVHAQLIIGLDSKLTVERFEHEEFIYAVKMFASSYHKDYRRGTVDHYETLIIRKQEK